jgi:hypothetical protein
MENGKMEAYINKAELQQADGETCSTKVRIRNKKACTQKTEIRMSSGNEEAQKGGVISGEICGQVTFRRGSSKVSVEGERIVHTGTPTNHNGSNANTPLGLQVEASQGKVFVKE